MATNKVWHGLSPMIDLGILLYNIMLYSWQPTNIFTVHTSPLHSFTMMFEWEQPLIIVGFSWIFHGIWGLLQHNWPNSATPSAPLWPQRPDRSPLLGARRFPCDELWQFCVLFKTWRTFKGKQWFWPYPKGAIFLFCFFGSPSKFKQPKNLWFRNKSHQSRG